MSGPVSNRFGSSGVGGPPGKGGVNQRLYDAAAACTGHEALCKLFSVNGLFEPLDDRHEGGPLKRRRLDTPDPSIFGTGA